MDYREALAAYTDTGTGFVGVTPNAAGWSSGNPLVEMGVALLLLKKLGLVAKGDSDSYSYAISACLPNTGAFFSKLPHVESNVSHDDLIGIVAAYSALGGSCAVYLEEDIIDYGKQHWWLLSTSGKFYWDAMTKPWHYAYYMLAAGHRPNMLATLSLAVFAVFDALFNYTNSSDKKLMWLMLETIAGRSKLVDLTRRFWWYRLDKTWLSMRAVFAKYYGPNHVFTLYCKE